MRTLATLAILVPTSAIACEELIQSCTFLGGVNTVTVCLDQGNVTYAYGPTGGPPELALSVPVVEADYIPWPGVGNSIWEAIRFRNGAWTYEVSAGFHKLKEGQDEPDPLFGGIAVAFNDQHAAQFTCDRGSVVWAGFGTGGIYGAKTDAGQCYDDLEKEWATCE